MLAGMTYDQTLPKHLQAAIADLRLVVYEKNLCLIQHSNTELE